MIECADLLEIRKKYFEERSLYSLFWNIIPEIIFDFLPEIGVFFSNVKCVEVVIIINGNFYIATNYPSMGIMFV